jgi:hypothetical protein
VLLQLISDFPDQVLENSMFSLMLLENPRLIEEIDPTILFSLFQQEDIPEIFFAGAVNQPPYVIKAIIQNRSVPVAILEQIGMTSQHLDICHLVIKHHLITPPFIHQLALNGRPSMKEAIARRLKRELKGHTTENLLPNAEEVISTLIENGTDKVRAIIAQIPHLPHPSIDRLVTKSDQDTLCRWATMKNTSGSVLRKLASLTFADASDTFCLQQAIAKNRNTPPFLINKFLINRSYKIRAAVAQRQNIPLKYCVRLAIDRSKNVRKKLFRNPSITVDMLTQLATHPNSQVRRFVSRHPRTPDDLRVRLLEQLEPPD